jgi:hypothetical protein
LESFPFLFLHCFSFVYALFLYRSEFYLPCLFLTSRYRYSYAFPIELIYRTPLSDWNPYGIPLNLYEEDGAFRFVFIYIYIYIYIIYIYYFYYFISVFAMVCCSPPGTGTTRSPTSSTRTIRPSIVIRLTPMDSTGARTSYDRTQKCGEFVVV